MAKTVDTVRAQLFMRRRWFFWPALLGMVVLGKLGILQDPEKAGRWLCDHAMRIEVR